MRKQCVIFIISLISLLSIASAIAENDHLKTEEKYKKSDSSAGKLNRKSREDIRKSREEIKQSSIETIKTHCSPADQLNWVVGKDQCLKIRTITQNPALAPDTLVVYLHGDGGRVIRPSDHLKKGVSKIDNENLTHIILMRPGYFDSDGATSTGASHRRARRGTGYNANYVEEIALAIKALKAHHKANKVVIVGHSGGAAIAALILGRHPGIAKGAVLAACPCDVKKWVGMAGKQSGRNALSPIDYVENIDKDATIIALTGTEDNNTFPVLAADYIEKIKENHISGQFIGVEGETHNSITKSPEFYQAIKLISGT